MLPRKKTKLQQNPFWNWLIFSTEQFWDTLKDLFGQNSWIRDFSKFSVIVWHGQDCDISQIKTEKVGAWPLWFFSIMTHMCNVFFFIFAIPHGEKCVFVDVTLSRAVQIWGDLPSSSSCWTLIVDFFGKIISTHQCFFSLMAWALIFHGQHWGGMGNMRHGENISHPIYSRG